MKELMGIAKSGGARPNQFANPVGALVSDSSTNDVRFAFGCFDLVESRSSGGRGSLCAVATAGANATWPTEGNIVHETFGATFSPSWE